jgi:chromosome segregation ATPase
MIKEIKERRHESQKSVNQFNDELGEAVNQGNALLSQIASVHGKIERLNHLIEMYKVMDEHSIMRLWELEQSLEITKKDFLQWKHDFETTKDGFTFKTYKQ